MLAWITAFLCERSQFVRIGTHSSTLQYINGGIPQGTKLGPLLFAVKVNECRVPRAKFVDDLTVLGILPRNSPSVMNNSRANGAKRRSWRKPGARITHFALAKFKVAVHGRWG